MKIQCADKTTFELQDDLQKLGHLTYNSFFSSKANVCVGDNSYEISPVDFFATTIAVTENGSEVANLKMNWKGHVIISFQNGQNFVLKAGGTFLNMYVLEDKDQQKIMMLNPHFNWAKFSYNYTVSFDNKPQNILLVLLTAYAANYYIAATSGMH